jgi:hypothetical protein
MISLSSTPEAEDVDFESIGIVGGILVRENKVSRLERARSREKAGEVCRLEAPAGCWSSGGGETCPRREAPAPSIYTCSSWGQFNGSDGGAKSEDNWKSNRVGS